MNELELFNYMNTLKGSMILDNRGPPLYVVFSWSQGPCAVIYVIGFQKYNKYDANHISAYIICSVWWYGDKEQHLHQLHLIYLIHQHFLLVRSNLVKHHCE